MSNKTKKQLTIRIDQDIYDHFKGFGPGYQTRINDFLRNALKSKSNDDEMPKN